jgi:cell division septal protein FtsQ
MKEKLIRFFQVAFMIVVLAGLGWSTYTVVHYARTSPGFEVKALSVSGMSGPLKRVTEEQIVGQAEFEVGTNVFRVDLNAIRERVERLQWVRHAIVERVLPDQIIIKVVEREPIGLARIRGEVYQFDVDAMILELDPISTASFPILDGLRGDDHVGNAAKVEIYRKVLDELGQNDLSEVIINEAHEVSVVSGSDPLKVSLGTSEFRTRWIKYLQLKTQIKEMYPHAVKVDVRFKNQTIIDFKEDDSSGQVVWDGAKKAL